MLEVLDNIPVNLSLKEILKSMQSRDHHKYFENACREIIETIGSSLRAQAIYKVAYVSQKNDDSLKIDGVKFTSHVLRVNLDKIERVFPFIVTCGRELNEIVVSPKDLLKGYCLDVIKAKVLRAASTYLKNYLKDKYKTAKLSSMAPGSLEDWPLTQQKELFSLFNKREAAIGVRLTDKFAMVPAKSVSGIIFPTEIKFESCQLCPRERCIGRRAPYDSSLSSKYGIEQQ